MQQFWSNYKIYTVVLKQLIQQPMISFYSLYQRVYTIVLEYFIQFTQQLIKLTALHLSPGMVSISYITCRRMITMDKNKMRPGLMWNFLFVFCGQLISLAEPCILVPIKDPYCSMVLPIYINIPPSYLTTLIFIYFCKNPPHSGQGVICTVSCLLGINSPFPLIL